MVRDLVTIPQILKDISHHHRQEIVDSSHLRKYKRTGMPIPKAS